MNKKIKVITGSLLTVMLLTISLFTNKVFGLQIDSDSYNQIVISMTNDYKFNIYLDGVEYDTSDNSKGSLEGFLLDSGEENTIPGYGTFGTAVKIKNVKHGVETYNEIILTYGGNSPHDGFEIFLDGTIYDTSDDTRGTLEGFLIDGDDELPGYGNYNVVFTDVSDTKRPAISGQENFVTSVDDAKPVSFFQSFLTAIDETDGVVPVYVKTDNYTANKSVLGTHKVIFGAKDNSGNEATLEAYIRVVDITKPIINGNASVVKVGYKEVWNIQNFKSTLTVSDNYDTLTNADITVKTDGYTANKSKLGTYNVIYAVKDKSGNEGTFTKPVQVYDNVRPTFSGPTNIATSNNTILTESDVRAQITANDEIDGNLTNKIKLVEDNFTGKGNKVGSYTIKYSVTDNAGNSAEFIVTIQRSDKLPPVIWIQDGVSIKTTSTTPLSFEVIIEILQATGQVSSSTTTTFRNEYDEYTGNENTPGIYAMSIRARSVDGNESVFNMAIEVLQENNEDDLTKEPGFNINTWIKENPAWASIIAVASLAIIVMIVKKTKK